MDLLHSLLFNLWSALLIVVFFGGSIFVHELGHFLAARRRGMVVECFSIGFGPRIFSWRGKDGVEYRVSWLPLGGYVRLPQLADMGAIEGPSKVDASRLAPVSYSTKMIVSVAGAACNILFAFLLACLVWAVGLPSPTALSTTRIGVVSPTLALPDGTVVPGPAAQAGLRPGDIIRAVDGKSVDDWLGFMQTLAASSGRAPDGRPEAVLTIERDGSDLKIATFPRLAGDDGFRALGIDSTDSMVIDSVLPDSPAALAGLRPGDVLLSANGVALYQQDTLIDLIKKTNASPLRLAVERDGKGIDFTLAARPTKNSDGTTTYRIGVRYQSRFVTLHPSPFAQIADDVVMTWRVLSGLVNPRSDLGPSKLSGAVGIVRGFSAFAQIDIRRVLWFTILINVNLALINLLPIPVLDGGHMVFATIARLRGRALPVRLVGSVQGTFMVLLLLLMAYVNFFDGLRWIRDTRAENAAATAPAPTAPAAPAK